VTDFPSLALAAGAGLLGGAMNALAGGGTFVTMPTLIALGLPGPIANATSNVSLQPGALASAWTFRAGLGPIGGIGVRTLMAITFVGAVAGSVLLVATPARAFDVVVPWLLLLATLALGFGRRGADWLHARLSIGRGSLLAAQFLLGIYGGYFGGAVGLMMVAIWGLLAGAEPHALAANRTLMLATANAAATIIFVACLMVRWDYCLPMLLGAIAGGWLGALAGKALSPRTIRIWTLIVTAGTTAVFFVRAYG
jgi:uncharacterized membrane protein YfcA